MDGREGGGREVRQAGRKRGGQAESSKESWVRARESEEEREGELGWDVGGGGGERESEE